MKATTLFGKYQICRELGRGRSGTVYLAKHMELEEYRAIKRVPRSCADYEQFKNEALILKSIRHPGIPIVYDIFVSEEEDCFYLIMEFLSGSSLFAYVSDMGHLSKAMTIRYGIQICHLVHILHSAKPTPILYLDLQPKNLLVCNDTIKLIDFDHSVPINEAEKLTKRYGTVGYAAPEQYTGETLDVRTDIYAIGTVLYYMLTGTYPESPLSVMGKQIDRTMAQIIRICLSVEKERRYPSVEELCEALRQAERQMKREKQRIFGSGLQSSLTIAVAGACSGVGTTHIAIGMAAFLRNCGMSAIYEEHNSSGAIRQLASCVDAGMDERGIFVIHGVPMLPYYGEAVVLAPHSYPIRVLDFGTDRQACFSESADGYILVCGGKPWQWECTRDAVSDPGIHPGQAIIYNHFCRQLRNKLPGPAKKTECFLMPYDTNPFASGEETNAVYESIFLSLTGEKTGGILRKLFGKIRVLTNRIVRKKTGGP
ncbi:MAG: serine/threonine protein kinase [Brotaphodocola sp.]